MDKRAAFEEEDVREVDVKSLRMCFWSKEDIYVYLTQMKQLFLPQYSETKMCKKLDFHLKSPNWCLAFIW